MGKEIKTKESIKNIKLKDTKNNLSHYIKEETITTKGKSIEEKKEPAEKSNAQVKATDNVVQTAKIATIQSTHIIKKHVKSRINARNMHQTHKNALESPKPVFKHKHLYRYKTLNTSNYVSHINAHFIHKYKMKIKKNTATATASKPINITVDAIKFSYTAIKKSVFAIQHVISYGTALILLLVMTLFIGVFSAFSDNTIYAASFIPLSEEVIAYTPVIEEYATQYGITEFIPLIQAIMMQESQGIGLDPMNSSSFIYNEHYPSNISEPEYSIDVGIHYLSDCLIQANVSSVNDTKNLYLAIQAYNFGTDYIQWAKDNFDGYSKSNAQLYSEQIAIIQNITTFGNPNYVEQVMQYIGFGFGTFRLEPNFDNHLAWGNNNPYSANKLYGQCTWFAWGRFYELYGFSPGFTGDGWNCAKQLVNAHPDQFELSSTPQVGAIFSCIGRNHVGIVVGWDGVKITIQEGNLDGKTNTFSQAKKDWQTATYEINHFRNICDGVIFVNKNTN